MTDMLGIVSLVLNLLFGGGLMLMVTLRATKRKANAEADSADIDNVKKAIDIWRDAAEELRSEVDHVNTDLNALVCEIASLKRKMEDIRSILISNRTAIEMVECLKKIV